MKKTIRVQNMTCQHCVGRVRKYLESSGSLSDIHVDLENNQASFESSPDLDLATIISDITDMGYPASE